MQFFQCNISSPLASEEDDFVAAIPPEQAPGSLVESSCSEQSEPSTARDHSNTKHFRKIPPRDLEASISGRTSPSAVCAQRKLSTAIASNLNSKHPTLAGRPTVVLPKLPLSSVSTTPSESSRMALPRSAPPKAPRTAPMHVLPNRGLLKERSISSSEPHNHQHIHSGNMMMGNGQKQRSVAPLPMPINAQKPVLHRASSAPSNKDRARDFRSFPAPVRLEAWSEPAAENFQVRGPTYLNDRVKNPSQESAFRLLTVDLVQCERPIYTGLCAHPHERVQQALQREQETGVKELPPFIFAVNLCVPGVQPYHQVTYFGVDDMEELEHPTTPFGRVMNQFIFGDSDEFRNKTFKLIPRIVDGNYIVRKAVGSKPSILGRKIKQYYIRGPNYFELIVDIASDPVAQRIVKLVLGYTKSMAVDMMFLLEGTDEQTLPERIFGGVRMKNIDFKEKDGQRVVEQPPTS